MTALAFSSAPSYAQNRNVGSLLQPGAAIRPGDYMVSPGAPTLYLTPNNCNPTGTWELWRITTP